MQIHIRPVARGDKNYVRAIVNQHVTSPAGDWFPVRSADDHVWLFTHNCRAPHGMYRRRRRGALQSVVSAHTWLCVSKVHKKNCFTILSTNIASIRSKLNELQIFLKNLEDSGISLGALCIQESWLSEHDDTSLIKLEGYNCITQGRTSSSRGGLLIYLHEKYNYTCKHFTNSFELWEN